MNANTNNAKKKNPEVIPFNKRKKFLQDFCKFYFYILGIYSGKKFTKIAYFVISPLALTFLMMGRTISFMNVTDPLHKLEAGIRVLVSFAMPGFILYYRILRKHFIEMALIICESDTNYMGDKAMKMVSERFHKAFHFNFRIYSAIMLLNWAGTVIEGQFVANKNYDFMHLYSCGSLDKPPTMSFCIKQGSIHHHLMNKLWDPIVFSLEIAIVIGIFLLNIIVTDYIEVRLILVGEKVRALVEKYKNEKYLRRDEVDFFAVIAEQQDILRRSRKIVSLLNFSMTAHSVMIYIFSIFGMIAILNPEFRSSYPVLRILLPVVYAIYMHYVCCKTSYTVGHIHDNIADAVLEMPWYERSLSFQKCYLQFLIIIQKNHPLYVCGLYEVDHKFFAANINRMYTLFNILMLKFKA